ncbi:OmpH family outer membrane protein [Paracoccus sp. (in: a-proteobacteria)]|uniref:OmpH family outer membrane protein n=1 Tax=Paracoccus sp. TaxID=267 RepID=UPI0026DFB09A|nr:OmpH family outer membrane protein [Paracoccus sp. (in: a-proteobacteria)]MDO5646840.1 OmpH family outer membrane protein [Paracoccus sp. (in: a-proteobacteria)]
MLVRVLTFCAAGALSLPHGVWAQGADLPDATIPGDAPAGHSLILTVDEDMLYLDSAWGIRAQSQLETQSRIIAAENDRLTRELSAEEADLTARRPLLPPAEFRILAEDFDRRATDIRRQRAQAVQDLNAWADADRAAFFRAALPVMGDIMQARGAAVVLDRRTIFVSLESIDITQPLIDAVNDQTGDGKDAVPLP